MKKKSLLFLTVLTCLTFNARAAYNVWDGTSMTPITPSGDVYKVESAAQLAWVAANNDALNGFKDKTIQLEVDVDLNGKSWTAIGSTNKPFIGTFKGQYHMVRNLGTFAKDTVGLFGYIGGKGTVSGIGITGLITFGSCTCAGSLAGLCEGKIKECWTMAAIEYGGSSTSIGGLVGELDGSITDCYSQSWLACGKTDGVNIGGLVGYSNGGSITRAYTAGYAYSGNNFVGTSKNADYEDCYRVSKLYNQKAGGADGDVASASVDALGVEFSSGAWVASTNKYPILKGFSDNLCTAAILSAVDIHPNPAATLDYMDQLTTNFSLPSATGLSFSSEGPLTISSDQKTAIVNRDCEDASTTGGNGVVTYTWYVGSEPLLYHEASLSYEVKAYNDYTFTRQDAAGCGLDWAEGKYIVHVRSAENASAIVGGTYVLCEGDAKPQMIVDNSPAGVEGLEYRWLVNDQLIPDSARANIYIGDYYYEADTTYIFRREYRQGEGAWLRSDGDVSVRQLSGFYPGRIDNSTLVMIIGSRDSVVVRNIESATGGLEPISYMWSIDGQQPFDSADSLVFRNFSGAEQEITISRSAKDSKCGEAQSAGEYTIKVVSPLTAGQIINPERLMLCNETVVDDTIRATAPTGVTGGYKYTWELKIDEGEWNAVGNADTIVLTSRLFAPEHTYTYRRWVVDSLGLSAPLLTDGEYTITSLPAFSAGSIVAKDTIIYGLPSDSILIRSDVAATGGYGEIAYSWKNKDGREIPDAKGDTLKVKPTAYGDYSYTRYAKDEYCQTTPEASGTYTIHVRKEFNAGALTALDPDHYCDVDAAQALTISGSDAEGGDGNYTYRWQVSVDGGAYAIVEDATEVNLPLNKVAMEQGKSYAFMREVKDGTMSGYVASENSVMVTIHAEFSAGSIVAKDTIIYGLPSDSILIRSDVAATGGYGEIAYSWKNKDGREIPDAKGDTLKVKPTAYGDYSYTRYAKDEYCQTTPEASGTYTIHLYPSFDQGKMLEDTLKFCEKPQTNDSIYATAAAGGDENYTYQWYLLTTKGSVTNKQELGTTQNQTLDGFDWKVGFTYQFYRTATDGTGLIAPVHTDTAVMYMYNPFSRGAIQSANDTLIGLPQIITVNSVDSAHGGDSIHIRYYWTNVRGQQLPGEVDSALRNYQLDTAGTYTFTRWVSDGACQASFVESDGTYQVVVMKPFQVGKIVEDSVAFCSDEEISYIVSPTEPQGGNTGHYTYQWYSVNPTDTTALNGCNELTLDLSKLDMPAGETYRFIQRVWDGSSYNVGLQTEGTMRVTILGKFDAGSIPTVRDTILVPDTVNIVAAPATGGINLTYFWQRDGKEIPGYNDSCLNKYVISSPGVYTFNRFVNANRCADTITPSRGTYTVVALKTLDPGAIVYSVDTACTNIDARQIMIEEELEPAGGTNHYLYQWQYTENGVDYDTIKTVTTPYLDLSNLVLENGHTYTFVRFVRDEFSKSKWTQSAGQYTVKVNAVLDPGEVKAAVVGYCLAIGQKKVELTLAEKREASGETTREYRWLMNVDTISEVVGTTREMVFKANAEDLIYGQTYTFVREVRNPNCGWVRSTGEIRYTFGQVVNTDVEVHTCELPYTMTWTDSQGNEKKYTFFNDGEKWTVSDHAQMCAVDTTFIVKVAEPIEAYFGPEVVMCNTEEGMVLSYEVLSGKPDRFHVTFDKDMAKLVGMTDTTGVITSKGEITFTNLPLMEDKAYKMTIELYNAKDKSHGLSCASATYNTTVRAAYSDLVKAKFDKVLFVDNGKGLYKAYQWYKNSKAVDGANGQYYQEEGAILRATYYVRVTDQYGHIYRSCDVDMPLETTDEKTAPMVYPCPVARGSAITIRAVQSRAEIWTMQGACIDHIEHIDGQTQAIAPYVEGVYIVRITNQDGETYVTKLIVE